MAELCFQSNSPRQVIVNGVLLQSAVFIEYFRLKTIIARLKIAGNDALEFDRAPPSVVKSIRQRELLKAWLRLYAPDRPMARGYELEFG